MKESNFIAELENRAALQKKLVSTEMMPNWAKGVGNWLAINPWRVMVPIAAAIYSVIRLVGGVAFREFILGLFGGFAR